jgi:hypothetical protein
MSDLMLPFTPLKIYDLLYSGVGAGAAEAGAASNFRPEPGLHKDDAAPQHCEFIRRSKETSAYNFVFRGILKSHFHKHPEFFFLMCILPQRYCKFTV